MPSGLLVCNLCCLCAAVAPEVYYQAHRGGLKEVPENTLAAYRHAWECPGAIPEMDVCTTKDNVFVCIHDDTLARTTTAPPELKHTPISQLAAAQIRQWDAGVRFNEKYAGVRVPLLTEVFDEMKGRPERQVYLDLKDIDLDRLDAMIASYGVAKQIIFVRENQAQCLELRRRFPGARTMTWLSGFPETIMRRFDELAAKNFDGVSQIQCHLHVKRAGEFEYVLSADFLKHAVAETRKAGVALQLRPFDFDRKSLQSLLDLGVRWFVTDEPKRFSETLQACSSKN